MRAAIIACVAAAGLQASAETHIGFEPMMDKDWNVIRVEDFYANAKARASGLLPGDTLIGIDRVPIKHPKTIANYCKRKKPGDVVILTVRRNGKHEGIEVELVDGEEMRKHGMLGPKWTSR